jgi:hypothetical protein
MKNKFNKKHFLLRIISFPFAFGLYVVMAVYFGTKGVLTTSFKFLMYGGEFITYKKDDKESIYTIYQKLKDEKAD